MQDLVSRTVCNMENISNLVAEHRTMFQRLTLDWLGSIEGPLTQGAVWDQTAQVYGKVAILDGFSK